MRRECHIRYPLRGQAWGLTGCRPLGPLLSVSAGVWPVLWPLGRTHGLVVSAQPRARGGEHRFFRHCSVFSGRDSVLGTLAPAGWRESDTSLGSARTAASRRPRAGGRAAALTGRLGKAEGLPLRPSALVSSGECFFGAGGAGTAPLPRVQPPQAHRESLILVPVGEIQKLWRCCVMLPESSGRPQGGPTLSQ